MKLNKRPQSNLFKTFKWAAVGAIAADVACLAGGYYYYRQLKYSPDFRYEVYKYDPRLIDVYYRANEKYGDGKARQADFQQWGVTKVESYSFINLLGL